MDEIPTVMVVNLDGETAGKFPWLALASCGKVSLHSQLDLMTKF